MVSEQYRERLIDTVYIGGGTPSSLSALQLASLLGGLRERFHFAPEIEFTLEANPATLDEEKLCVFTAAHDKNTSEHSFYLSLPR